MSPAIRVTKEVTFDSAHFLPGHPGKCADMHGHTYRLQVTVGLPLCRFRESDGMVMDFSCLSEVIEVIHARVDHRVLNKVLGYKPTAENMVLRFGEEIKTLLPEGVFLDCVRLWETPTSFAEYLVGGSPCRTCDCQS